MRASGRRNLRESKTAPPLETTLMTSTGALPPQRRTGKRSRADDPHNGDDGHEGAAPEPRSKKSRIMRLLRYRRTPSRTSDVANSSRGGGSDSSSSTESASDNNSHSDGAIGPAFSGGCTCATLPPELVSLIVNGCDMTGRPFMHPRWRAVARAVCRAWRHIVQNPSAPDAARIAVGLADPRSAVRQLWVSGRLVCASAVAERLAVNPGLSPDAGLLLAHGPCSDASWSPPPLLAAAALVASARPDAIAYAFSRDISSAAVGWLRPWLRRDRESRSTGPDVLRPPVSDGTAPGPDVWWVRGLDGAPPLRPWEGMRRVVGCCARSALSAVLLRVAARHGSAAALDRLLAVDDTPCGAADAAFDAAAAGHTAFVLRLASLVATSGGDRSRAATVCYHAWLGAAAGGHACLMHALLDAESKRGSLATALWRGRCLSDGSPRHPRTASHMALTHDSTGYFDVARDRDPAYRDTSSSLSRQPPSVCRPIDAYFAEALRVGALGVARWLVDDARATGAASRSDIDASLGVLALGGLIEVVVDGRGSRERARRTIEWMRDTLGIEPGPSTLGVLVSSAHAFRWTRPGSAAARGRLNADRYARLLDVLVDVVEVWPQTAIVEVECDDDEDADDEDGYEDAFRMCSRRDGGGDAYGACVVRLLMERVACGRIAGDRHGRRHARRRALGALDRLAACVVATMPKGSIAAAAAGASFAVQRCTDPWTVAVARVRAEISKLDRAGTTASPMRALDALLGAAAVAHRCMLSSTLASALAGPDYGGLPPMLFGLVANMRDKGIGPDNDRARAWRRWCRMSDAPDARPSVHRDSSVVNTEMGTTTATIDQDNATASEFACIGAWAERIQKHLMASR
ncbi:hypothetical protein psal_cds_276 [Pandoravirus salinus]|uniref:F-box incomplete domain containing protein n=1 Tax=Pandoravirus salinus TaxID=1349410 RepID=S4VU33_9VIRU|nr:hypothetical protein psal_cds_276 [Pandoravirus salinus]AGO83858.1 hypothetical protein psal_cds_276 [Pandoravirus salinus]